MLVVYIRSSCHRQICLVDVKTNGIFNLLNMSVEVLLVEFRAFSRSCRTALASALTTLMGILSFELLQFPLDLGHTPHRVFYSLHYMSLYSLEILDGFFFTALPNSYVC